MQRQPNGTMTGAVTPIPKPATPPTTALASTANTQNPLAINIRLTHHTSSAEGTCHGVQFVCDMRDMPPLSAPNAEHPVTSTVYASFSVSVGGDESRLPEDIARFVAHALLARNARKGLAKSQIGGTCNMMSFARSLSTQFNTMRLGAFYALRVAPIVCFVPTHRDDGMAHGVL